MKNIVFTLKEIAEKINAELIGDKTFKICGVSSFEDAKKDQLTFASDAKYFKKLRNTRAGAIIIPAGYKDFNPRLISANFLKSKNPKLHFFRILRLFYPEKKQEKIISSEAHIGKNFVSGYDITIGSNVFMGNNVLLGNCVTIMPGVYIGDDVEIGDNTVIKPNVTLMDRTKVGKRVIIHSGSVLGSDGFGFTPDNEKYEKLPHAGYVQIDDDVEIGACNTIDRGTFGKTWLRRGVKTDNLVHIAHNVTLGSNTLIAGQAGIAGSTNIGKNVIIAGKAGIAGHLKINDFSIIGPGAGVMENIDSGEIVSGVPSMPHKLWLKITRIILRLPDIRKRLLILEKIIKKKKAKSKNTD